MTTIDGDYNNRWCLAMIAQRLLITKTTKMYLNEVDFFSAPLRQGYG
jgi:hypothetical protein